MMIENIFLDLDLVLPSSPAEGKQHGSAATAQGEDFMSKKPSADTCAVVNSEAAQ